MIETSKPREAHQRRWSEIRVVTSPADLEKVFAFRYRVYVEEMARKQSAADHDRRVIKDEYDIAGINVAALDGGGGVVGVVRVNLAVHSDLGPYEKFYEMKSVGLAHPAHTSVVTRLMIAPHLRRSRLAVELCLKCYSIGLEHDIKWCFIDCNDHLISFFQGLGFEEYVGKKVHDEYGLVTPMRLALHARRRLEAVQSPFAARLRAWTARPHLAGAGVMP